MLINALFDPFAPITQQALQTQLFFSVLTQPPGCEPCRTESPFTIQIGSKLYRFVLRDKIVPEDPYLIAFKAAAFSVARTEEYRGVPTPRNVRDYLIKSNVVI